MIVFDLACVCGFTFEGWFHDRDHLEKQLHDSLLACPRCRGREIRKILSPVRFQTAGSETADAMQHDISGPVTTEEAEKALETLQRFVAEHFEDVGCDLAREALKMHYGVAESRNIRGVATEEEEKKLQEEGIDLLKFPMPSKSKMTN